MIRRMVRYTAREDELETVLIAVQVFVESVNAREPDTVYAAFREADGRSFVHLMAFPDEAAEARHRDARHTRQFVEALYPRCERMPEFVEVEPLCLTHRLRGLL